MGTPATGMISDTRIACQLEFQISAHKGGDQWKGNTDRYIIPVVLAAHALFTWAGRHSDPITKERCEAAVGFGLTTWDREGAEVDNKKARKVAAKAAAAAAAANKEAPPKK